MPRKPKHIKGQGSLFQDERSPYWQLSYWNGWRQVRESSKTKNKEQPAKILKQRVADLAEDRGGPEHIRVKTLFALLLDNYRRLNRSSLYQTELRLEKYLNDFFGELKRKEVTSKRIREYIEFRNGAAPSTINQELAIVRRAFALGADEEPPLVTRRLRITKLKEDNVREGFLEHDRYRELLYALCEPVRPMFVVGYHIGTRLGELLRIRRDWVDFREGLIYINGRVTKNKTSRTAPIYGDMRGWLEMAMAQAEALSPHSKHLFVWLDGSPIRDFRESWAQATEAVGLSGLLFHDLRRTAARNLIRAGNDEKTVMRILGHKTPAMLWRYNITSSQGRERRWPANGSIPQRVTYRTYGKTYGVVSFKTLVSYWCG